MAEFREYLAIVGRHWRVLMTTISLTMLAATVALQVIPPTYSASTTLRVSTVTAPGSEFVSYDSIMYAVRLLSTYSKLATSEQVQAELAARLSVVTPPRVKADVPANSELLILTTESPDPVLAAEAANFLAELVIGKARESALQTMRESDELIVSEMRRADQELEDARRQLAEAQESDPRNQRNDLVRAVDAAESRAARVNDQYQRARLTSAARTSAISVLERASTPESPTHPRKMLMLLAALALSAAAGIGLCFVRESLDSRLRTTRQLEEAINAPIVGAIPRVKAPLSGALRDAIRRARLRIAAPDSGTPSVMLVTSSRPGEGASTVSALLGQSFAEAGQSVVLVDANFRDPSLHTAFGLQNGLGLSSVLYETATWDAVIQNTPLGGLTVISAGPAFDEQTEALGSTRMHELLKDLRRWFDVVVIDAPAVISAADAAALAPLVDEVELVVAQGRAELDAVQCAQSELGASASGRVNVIVNLAESAHVGELSRTVVTA